jgi:hypothetical protein
MFRVLAALALLMGALAIGPAPAAASQIIGFNYLNVDGLNPPTASGHLIINDLPEPGGGYLITAITGQHNGNPISGLIPPGDPVFFNDNLFFFSEPHLHSFGFAFTVAGPGGGERYNVFNTLSPPNCGGANEYAELSTGNCSDGIQVLFSVPEPGDLGLLAAALIGLATTRRLRLARQALPCRR